MANRVAKVAAHVTASTEAVPIEEPPAEPGRPTGGANIDVGISTNLFNSEERDSFRGRMGERPRVSKDLSTWTPSALMKRAIAMGASDEQVDACLTAPSPADAFRELASSMEPPPPSAATVADITCDPATHTVEEMGRVLETVGALVILNAAPESLMQAVDLQIEEAGGWAVSREGKGRMRMDILMHAPATRELITNEHVLGVTNHVLGPHSKQIALKEMSVFEVQPGQGKQDFHREDQFWPWHHEPYPWSTNILWAIDDFTPENGGTNVIPYSHRSTEYMRESGREMLDGNFNAEDVLKVGMPRGSVLLFTGGLIHGSGKNETDLGRKSLLSSYQLGWLRPEYKFWAHRPLHDALSAGEVEPVLTALMGHDQNPYETKPGDAEYGNWAGNRAEGMYLARSREDVETELDGDDAAIYQTAGYGFEAGGEAGERARPEGSET